MGFRPKCPEADDLLDWEDATIECPDDPQSFLQFIDSLLADPGRLERARVRNFESMLRAHDWGYRIVEMLAVADVGASHLWARRREELMVMSRSGNTLGVTCPLPAIPT